MSGGDSASERPRQLGSQRLDKWLWFVRVARTRTLAAGLVTDGRVRINRERTMKPSHLVRVGDVITIAVGQRIRVLEVLAPGDRRGSASEAQALFLDRSPAPEPAAPRAGGQRDEGSGRPTKRERRAIDRLLQGDEC